MCFRFTKSLVGFGVKIAKAEFVYLLLPKKNCKKCGYRSCAELAVAVASGRESIRACKVRI
ncbi:(Fe-S)-binding protein [Archaeoglobus sp.]